VLVKCITLIWFNAVFILAVTGMTSFVIFELIRVSTSSNPGAEINSNFILNA
jgi:hypothetical protein